MRWTSTPGRAAAVAVVAALAGLATGCTSAGPMSIAQFRQEASALCRSTRAAVGAFPKPDPTDPIALVESGARALAVQKGALRKLAAFKMSTADRPAVQRWISVIGRALDAVDTSLAAQRRGDFAAAGRANTRGTDLVKQADAAARALSLPDCATPVAG